MHMPHHCSDCCVLCSTVSWVRIRSRGSSSGLDGACRVYSTWENKASSLARSAALTCLCLPGLAVLLEPECVRLVEVRLWGWIWSCWMGSQVEENIDRTSRSTSICRTTVRPIIKAHIPFNRRQRQTLILAQRQNPVTSFIKFDNKGFKAFLYVLTCFCGWEQESEFCYLWLLYSSVCSPLPPLLSLSENRSTARLGRSELIWVCLLAPFVPVCIRNRRTYCISIYKWNKYSLKAPAGLFLNDMFMM